MSYVVTAITPTGPEVLQDGEALLYDPKWSDKPMNYLKLQVQVPQGSDTTFRPMLRVWSSYTIGKFRVVGHGGWKDIGSLAVEIGWGHAGVEVPLNYSDRTITLELYLTKNVGTKLLMQFLPHPVGKFVITPSLAPKLYTFPTWPVYGFGIAIPGTHLAGNSLSGQLISLPGGIPFPLKNVEVASAPEAKPSQRVTGLTDSHGKFTFTPSEPGQWIVKANVNWRGHTYHAQRVTNATAPTSTTPASNATKAGITPAAAPSEADLPKSAPAMSSPEEPPRPPVATSSVSVAGPPTPTPLPAANTTPKNPPTKEETRTPQAQAAKAATAHNIQSRREPIDGLAQGFPICIVRVISKDNKFIWFGRTSDWKVMSARVNLTRYWASSQAEIKLAWTSSDPCTAVQPPPIKPEDIVEIFMGYSDSPNCDPKEFIALKEGGRRFQQLRTNDGESTPIASAIFTYPWSIPQRINKVFHGIVDTDGLKLGSGQSSADGVVLTVTCRDTMRYLINNRYSAELPLVTKGGTVAREEIIRKLTILGSGVLLGPLVQNNPVIGYQCGPKEINGYSSIEPSGRMDIQLSAASDSSVSGNYLVMNKVPVDVIRHFSTVDTRPMELYASNKTGGIYWTSRYLSGLDPDNRTDALPKRQYCYMTPFDRTIMQNGKQVTRRILPNIIAAKLDWTTLSTVTDFAMINPMGQTKDGQATAKIIRSQEVQAKVDPRYLSAFRPFVVNRFIFDDTLTQNETDQSNEARLVLEALLNTFAKDVRGGMVTVTGDPFLEIGEAVQLFNTGLFSEETFRVEAVSHLFAVGGTQTGFLTVFAAASPEAEYIGGISMMPGVEDLNSAAYIPDIGKV